MNTPLGAYAQSKQDERDAQEAAFRRQYGVDTATTPERKVRAVKAVASRIKHLADCKRRVEFAKSILGASGRTPAFG
jgi:hypothetical protein